MAADGRDVSRLSLPSLDSAFSAPAYAADGGSLSFNITLTEKAKGNPNSPGKFESIVLVNHLGTSAEEALSFKFDVIVNGYQWDAKADADTRFALEFKLISQSKADSNATVDYKRDKTTR
eukprot:1174535-Prorocentrum_minimum.AAC.1